MRWSEYPVEIEATIYFLTAEEGGRTIPAFSGYRPQLYYDGQDWVAIHIYPDVEQVNPGDTVRTQLSLLQPEAHVGKLFPGKEFVIREGNKTVARGVVTKLINLSPSSTPPGSADA